LVVPQMPQIYAEEILVGFSLKGRELG